MQLPTEEDAVKFDMPAGPHSDRLHARHRRAGRSLRLTAQGHRHRVLAYQQYDMAPKPGVSGVAPALADAIYDGVRTRVRDYPITIDKLLVA